MQSDEQSDDTKIKELRQQAIKWVGVGQVTKQEIYVIMAYSTVPHSLMFVILFFYALVTNQALDKTELNQMNQLSNQYKIDRMKLFYLFKILMSQDNIYQTLSHFDPTKITLQTLEYLDRLREDYLGGGDPKVTNQKIQALYAQLPHRLWNYSNCMLKIRQLLID